MRTEFQIDGGTAARMARAAARYRLVRPAFWTGTHHYASAVGARVVGDAVVLRIRGARVLVLLPAEVVPAAVRPRLGLAP